MAKPWTKKAHERVVKRKTKRKVLQKSEKADCDIIVAEFTGNLKNLLKSVNPFGKALVVDLKRNKIVYGPCHKFKYLFKEFTYNGELASLEGAALLKFIYKYTHSFFGRLFEGMNGSQKKGFVVVKAGLKVIRNWGFFINDENINQLGCKRLEDSFGFTNNRDQIILISTDDKTDKILEKVFEKISPQHGSTTAIDAKEEIVENYSIDRISEISGNDLIRLCKDSSFTAMWRVEDFLDAFDKTHLTETGEFVTLHFLINNGFSEKDARKVSKYPVNLEKAAKFIYGKFLREKPKPEYQSHKNGEIYFDIDLLNTTLVEYFYRKIRIVKNEKSTSNYQKTNS